MNKNTTPIPNCPYCGGNMDKLPDYCPSDKVGWYGCDPCNTVFEFDYSMTDKVYIQTFWISYIDYLQLTKKRTTDQ